MTFLAQLQATLLPISVFLAIGVGLEAVLPNADPRPERNLVLNLGCTLVFWGAYVAVWAGLWVTVAGAIQRLPGAGLVRVLADAGSLRTAAVFLLALVLRDGCYYGLHRLQHQFAWLWAEHAVHHSDEQMNVTTSWRHHWLEFGLLMIFVLAPVSYVVKLPPVGLISFSLFGDLMGYFVHMNSTIGWRSWLLASPQSHRIHHSRELAHRDKNFAVSFPIWDVLFGTYYAPAKGEYPKTGIVGERVVTIWRAAALPFLRWWGMLRPLVLGCADRVTVRSYTRQCCRAERSLHDGCQDRDRVADWDTDTSEAPTNTAPDGGSDWQQRRDPALRGAAG